MSDERDPKEQEKGPEAPSLELKRREFLKTLGLVAGGAIAYSAPAVQATALGTSPQGTTTVRLFDVATPARYSVSNDVKLDVIVDGQPVPVAFRAYGSVELGKTTDPDVSRVRILSMQFDSIDPDPLASAGVDTGRIHAAIPASTDIGHLNHRTGVLSEHSFPIGITYEKRVGSPISTQVNPTRAAVSDTGGGDRKCTKDNDVDIPVDATTFVRGNVLLGMVPSTVSSGTVTGTA